MPAPLTPRAEPSGTARTERRPPDSFEDSLHHDYPASTFRARRVAGLIEAIRKHQGAAREAFGVLDVGCGTGNLLRLLREKGYRQIRGVEVLPPVVEKLNAEGFDVDLHNVEEEPICEGRPPVDVVVSLEVLEHLYNPAAAIAKMRGALKPGGHAIFSVPNEYHFKQRLRALMGRPISDVTKVGGHIKLFNYQTFPKMVAGAGFEIVEATGMGATRIREVVPLYPKLMRLWPSLLASWILVIGRKA